MKTLLLLLCSLLSANLALAGENSAEDEYTISGETDTALGLGEVILGAGGFAANIDLLPTEERRKAQLLEQEYKKLYRAKGAGHATAKEVEEALLRSTNAYYAAQIAEKAGTAKKNHAPVLRSLIYFTEGYLVVAGTSRLIRQAYYNDSSVRVSEASPFVSVLFRGLQPEREIFPDPKEPVPHAKSSREETHK